jgi:hypothetical protein
MTARTGMIIATVPRHAFMNENGHGFQFSIVEVACVELLETILKRDKEPTHVGTGLVVFDDAMIETAKTGESLGFQHFDESIATINRRLAMKGGKAPLHTEDAGAQFANRVVVTQIPIEIIVFEVVAAATADATFGRVGT